MNAFRFSAVVIVSSVLAFAVEANPKGHGNSGQGPAKHSATVKCPPGLAKKDPPCIPPGQAKKRVTADEIAPPIVMVPSYEIGDIDQYVILADPRVFNPRIDVIYASYGGYLYVIERASEVVLLRLGPTSDWTWAWDATDVTSCPPGLAKKDPSCIPPGLAAQNVVAGDIPKDPYGIGESLPAGYIIALDPKLYAPNERAQFVREGDVIYCADDITGEVLDNVGMVGKIIN